MIDDNGLDQGDWFSENSPSAASDDVLRNANPSQIPGAPGYGGNTGITGLGGGFSGNLEQLWNQFRSAHPEFQPTQGAASSLQPFVEFARSQGANISIAGPSSGGYVKGITDERGQFVKLLDGSDKPIWLPGGDAQQGAGQFGETFSYPKWTKQFAAPTSVDESNDPGFAFRQKVGSDAILQNASKMGIARTGGTLKDIDQWNQNYASSEYDKVYGRALDSYNSELANYMGGYNRAKDQFLTKYGIYNDNFTRDQSAQGQAFNQQYSLANLGLNAANAQAGLYTGQGNTAANIYTGGATRQGDYTTQIGNANAAGQVGSANAWTTAFGNVGSDLSTIYGNQGKSVYRSGP